MKEILKNLALLAVFAVVFSSLSGCGGPAATNSGSNNNVGINNSGIKPPDSGSAYPPLVSSITNADLELIEGSTTKVADRKGKVLLLNLWATWCGPCRSEMPHLVEMQEKYREQDFQVLGLNVGDDAGPESIDDIKKFAGNMKLNYELARIPDELTREFYKATNFQAIPISVLVDREGRLRGVFLGGGPNVIKSMKEVVAKVVAGQETADMANAPTANTPNKPEGQKIELIEVNEEPNASKKDEKNPSGQKSQPKK
jgi:thiol-disulfide isomerase/thioredoxin